MTIGPGVGDLSFDPVGPGNTERIRVLDRGKYECDIETTDLEQSFSITTAMRNETLTEAAAARLQDFLLQSANFSGTTTVNANSDIWSFRVVVTMSTGGVSTVYTIPNCRATFSFAEGEEGHSISISGVNNGLILRDGVTIPVTP